MFATGINCSVGTNKDSFYFSRSNIIQHPPSQAPSIRFPRCNAMNPGHCSPSNIYVPNLPIQTSRHYSAFGSSASSGTYYTFPSTNSISTYSSYYGHWNFGNNNVNAHFLSHPRPVHRNGRYTDLSTYGNSTYFVNDRSHVGFSTISYNNRNINSVSHHQHIAGNPFYGNCPINYAQTNPFAYHHYPGNVYQLPSSNQCIIPNAGGHKSAFAICKNKDLCTSQPDETKRPASTLATPAKPVESETDSNNPNKDVIPQQEVKAAFGSLVKSIDDVTSKNKRNQKKNVMLVSLPGGQPLFSVPLKPSPSGKKRGRPPKPKPGLQESQPLTENLRTTKLRYKRGRSHLKLLQPAPNLKPCVATLAIHQAFTNQINSATRASNSSSTTKTDTKDADIQIIGCFPRGTTHLKTKTAHIHECETDSRETIFFADCDCKNDQSTLNTSLVQQDSGKLTEEYLKSKNSMLLNVNTTDIAIITNIEKSPTHITSPSSHDAPKLEKKRNANPNGARKKLKQSLPKNYYANDKKKIPNGQTLDSLKNATLALKDRQCLDMPNIFELLDTPNATSQMNNDDPNQNDRMAGTAGQARLEMNDEAATSVKKSAPRKQSQQLTESESEDTTTSYNRYVHSFLSDDESDADVDPKRMDKLISLENPSKDNSIASNNSRNSHFTISCEEAVDSFSRVQQPPSETPACCCSQIENEPLQLDGTDEAPTLHNASITKECSSTPNGTGKITPGICKRMTKSPICNDSSKNENAQSSQFLSLWQHFIDFKESESAVRHKEIHTKKIPNNTCSQRSLRAMEEIENDEHLSAFAKVNLTGTHAKPAERRHDTKHFVDKDGKFPSIEDRENLIQALGPHGADTNIKSLTSVFEISSDVETEVHSPISSPEMNNSKCHDLQLGMSQNGKETHDENFRNKKVKRTQRTQAPAKFVPKRQKIIANTMYDKSQSLDLTKSHESKEVMKSQSKSRCRTNSMIRNLIKYTKRQSFKTGNETKSKLNADLNKVFLLGSNPPLRRKFAGVEKLKEILLEIPGPMERRAKLRYSMKEKAKHVSVKQNADVHKARKTGEQVVFRNNQEPPFLGSNTMMLSESEDDENNQTCLDRSTTHRSIECFETKGRIFQNDTNELEEKKNHSNVVPNEDHDFEDDDGDILDIHAERDSMLDMFD